MSELRFNRITGDWVIIAGAKTQRPEDFVAGRSRTTSDLLGAQVQTELDPFIPPARVVDCPFCPGNEAMSDTLATIDRGESWGVRVVRNKFPALSPCEEKANSGAEMRRSVSGFGYHEVIIEHPDHNRWLWKQSAGGVSDFLEMLRRRYVEIGQDPRVELVVPFKNHGRSAGTSLLHPHTQIVGTPIMAADVRRRVSDAIRYYDENGQCLFCSVMDDECGTGERVVHTSQSFVSFIPYAALSPFHIMLFPTEHSPDFGSLEENAIADLAAHLRALLETVEARLVGPDFNFVLRSILPGRTDPRSYHWYMSIIPHVAGASGFAMGSGMFINSAIPEESARFLRGD